ncbi:MAG: phosphopyruvate hydratase [Patescibacteria group bacterium]
MKITQLKAIQILDSRGNPTIQVVACSDKVCAKASVPSGASTGKHEACELRDGGKLFGGKGVLKAIENINKKIFPKLKNQDLTQQEIDEILIELDGTENKSKLGANAILGVSLACARLGAKFEGLNLFEYIAKVYGLKKNQQLPVPMMNVINGGKHADSGLDIQEFMLVPAGIKKYSEQVRAGAEIFQALKNILIAKKYKIAVGDEGGFAPSFKNHEEVFEILIQAIKKAGYKAGKEIFLAIDVAASELFKKNKYNFSGKENFTGEMIEVYEKWVKKYPIISIEDGLAEDDWMGWGILSHDQKLKKTLLVGDDLFTTNIDRLNKGIGLGVANSILIKLNQIGTLSETIECIRLAQANNYKVVISHRSGETSDTFIADLAVAVGAEFIKAGAPNRGERVAKYNRLLEIESK